MNKKVVFYSGSARNFRTTLFGHLYKLVNSNKFEIILLHENLDEDIMFLLQDKLVFKNLELINVSNLSNEKNFILRYRKQFYYSKNFFKSHKPFLFVYTSDFHSIFEILMSRHAKFYNSICVSISCTITVGKMQDISKWVCFQNSFIKQKYSKLKKASFIFLQNLKSILFIYFIPLINFTNTLKGTSNFYLYKGLSGMRKSDYHILFSTTEKASYIDTGVLADKIFLIKHPLRNPDFYSYYISSLKSNIKIDILILINSDLITISSNLKEFKFFDERLNDYEEIISYLRYKFPNYSIGIKPHPDTNKSILNDIKAKFLSFNLQYLDSFEPIDIYAVNAKIILEFPRSVSTALLISRYINPNSLIISLDIYNEFLGSYYKNIPVINYVESLTNFKKIFDFRSDTNLNLEYDNSKFNFDNLPDFIDYLSENYASIY